MPVINQPDKITDSEIEKSLMDNEKMEKLLDKIFKIFSKQPDSSIKKLQKKMEPYLNSNDNIIQQRKALRTIKEFLNKN